MWSALRGGASHPAVTHQWKNLASSYSIFTRPFSAVNKEMLSLAEVEKVLNDVGADDVKVIQAPERYEYTDYMVIATGRSPWHVRNISQALIYKAGIRCVRHINIPAYHVIHDLEKRGKSCVKQKQRGAKRMLLPSVVGQEGGKWVVIDSGKLIIHAVDENARAYYDFERLWTSKAPNIDNTQDLEKAFVKVRPKNNSKKRPQARV